MYPVYNSSYNVYCIIRCHVQFVAGLAMFLGGGSSPTQRKKHAPVHMFFGRATFVIGLATMMVRAVPPHVAKSHLLDVLELMLLSAHYG